MSRKIDIAIVSARRCALDIRFWTAIIAIFLVAKALLYAVGVSERRVLNRELILAIKSNDITMVRSLLESGADPNAKEEAGNEVRSPWLSMESICGLLRRENSEPRASALEVLLRRRAEHVRWGLGIHPPSEKSGIAAILLAHGADANAPTTTGEPLLLIVTGYACSGDGTFRNTLRCLLDHDANVNVRGNGGITPLMLSVMLRSRTVAGLLMQYRADLNAADDYGNTPLITAAGQDQDANIALDLLRSGAKIDIRRSDGATAADVAQQAGARWFLRVLRSYRTVPGHPGTRNGAANKDSRRGRSINHGSGLNAARLADYGMGIARSEVD